MYLLQLFGAGWVVVTQKRVYVYVSHLFTAYSGFRCQGTIFEFGKRMDSPVAFLQKWQALYETRTVLDCELLIFGGDPTDGDLGFDGFPNLIFGDFGVHLWFPNFVERWNQRMAGISMAHTTSTLSMPRPRFFLLARVGAVRQSLMDQLAPPGINQLFFRCQQF